MSIVMKFQMILALFGYFLHLLATFYNFFGNFCQVLETLSTFNSNNTFFALYCALFKVIGTVFIPTY